MFIFACFSLLACLCHPYQLCRAVPGPCMVSCYVAACPRSSSKRLVPYPMCSIPKIFLWTSLVRLLFFTLALKPIRIFLKLVLRAFSLLYCRRERFSAPSSPRSDIILLHLAFGQDAGFHGPTVLLAQACPRPAVKILRACSHPGSLALIVQCLRPSISRSDRCRPTPGCACCAARELPALSFANPSTSCRFDLTYCVNPGHCSTVRHRAWMSAHVVLDSFLSEPWVTSSSSSD